MNSILPAFKIVSLVFASSAIVTGVQAIIDPVGFSRFFGMPITTTTGGDADKFKSTSSSRASKLEENAITSYVSLMGVRQLATGITLVIFGYQGKWTEMATILAILGVVVAGTDGVYLWRAGAREQGKFHAIPGILIALLAGATVWTST